MLIFLLSLVCLLGAVTAFLVWAFWPVIFQDFRADMAAIELDAKAVEAGVLAELSKAGLTNKPKA